MSIEGKIPRDYLEAVAMEQVAYQSSLYNQETQRNLQKWWEKITPPEEFTLSQTNLNKLLLLLCN